MRIPVGYLRKSRVIDPTRGTSWETQEAKVRELAATYGDNGGRLLLLSDWNISGRKGADSRPGYKRLVEMILGDECSALYSYSLSRLSRSVQDLRALMAMADKHEVPVRLVADRIDTSSATGRMLFTILSAVDEMTADLASEHARDAVVARRARGDQIGPVNYGEKDGEDLPAVIAAYEEAGSFKGAARLLNGPPQLVPTRRGGKWSTTSVRQILVREGAATSVGRPGAKARGRFLLSGILRCHCQKVMTGLSYRNGTNADYRVYRCMHHWQVPDHGLASVPEKKLLGWVKDEVARFRVPKTVVMETERQAERDRLEARKASLSVQFEMQGITREEYARRLTAVKADEAALEAKEAAVAIVPIPQSIDWDHWAPEDLNKFLTSLWEYVALDEKMNPVEAKWRYPEMRGEAVDREVRLADLPAAQREAILAKVAAVRHAKER